MSRENEKKTVAQVISGAVCGTIMILCVLVYVILGITLNFWHPGWIIMVAGGLTCGIVGIITNTIADLKQIKKEENKENR